MKMLAITALTVICFVARDAVADDPTSTIDIRATGEIVAASNVVTLQIKVSTARDNVQNAKEDNDAITAEVFELANSQELPKPQLIDTALRINRGGRAGKQGKDSEQADAFGGEDEVERLFSLTRDLVVSFRDVSQAVEFINEIASWRSFTETRELQLMPLKFDVANRESAFLAARLKALRVAEERARNLANQAGLELGEIVRIEDVAADSRTEDPFGGSSAGELEPVRRAVPATEPRKASSQDVDLDRMPPAQLMFSATVRIVFSVTKPQ